MSVLAAGLIYNGNQIFTVDYQQEIMGNPGLRSSLISALQSFGQDAFGDETEELRLGNSIVCLNTFSLLKGQNFLLYAVVSKSIKSTKRIKSALASISQKLVTTKYAIDPEDETKNNHLRSIFDAEFRSLPTSFAERLRKKI